MPLARRVLASVGALAAEGVLEVAQRHQLADQPGEPRLDIVGLKKRVGLGLLTLAVQQPRCVPGQRLGVAGQALHEQRGLAPRVLKAPQTRGDAAPGVIAQLEHCRRGVSERGLLQKLLAAVAVQRLRQQAGQAVVVRFGLKQGPHLGCEHGRWPHQAQLRPLDTHVVSVGLWRPSRPQRHADGRDSVHYPVRYSGAEGPGAGQQRAHRDRQHRRAAVPPTATDPRGGDLLQHPRAGSLAAIALTSAAATAGKVRGRPLRAR